VVFDSRFLKQSLSPEPASLI